MERAGNGNCNGACKSVKEICPQNEPLSLVSITLPAFHDKPFETLNSVWCVCVSVK